MNELLTKPPQDLVCVDGIFTPEFRRVAGRVDLLEAEMRKLPQMEIEPTHLFSKGTYARQITVPAGTLLTGKIHRTEHLNIISQGEISVWTEHEGVKRIKAPFSFVAPPGTRRVGFAHTDCVWTTIHANPDDTHDLDKLEAVLIEPHNAPEQITGGNSPCHGSLSQ